MKIAVVHQKTKFADTKENLKKAEKLVREAAQNKADIINFPEFFTTGFSFSNRLLEDVAESRNPIEEIRRMAKEYNIAIGGSYLNFQNNNVFNTYVLEFPTGEEYFHSKDIPTAYEGYCYAPGDDERVFHTPLGDIGVALCWEQIRYKTVKSMLGKVDFILAGSCWWNFNEIDPEVMFNLRDYNSKLALDAPIELAKLLKVPVFHSSHTGKFNGKVFPKGDMEQYREIVGASQIIESDGSVIKRQMYDEDETILYYDFEPKEKNLYMKINTDEYWIPKLPDVVVKNWDYLNSKCYEYYNKISLPYMLKLKNI